MQELRLLQEKDLESMYPIYVHYVKTSVAIFDLVPGIQIISLCKIGCDSTG